MPYRFDYDELQAEIRGKAQELLAEQGGRRRGAGKRRDPSRTEALIELAKARLARDEAEGRWRWEGNRITIR